MKKEILALTFGMLIILITFGDSHLVSQVGNLDTIFGLAYWRLFDVVYPVASVMVFLLYGKEKGGLKINLLTVLIFSSYLGALALICLDDIGIVLNLSIVPPVEYWVIMEWLYPIYAVIAFALFGKTNQAKK
jgi:hypothetical protein